MSVLSGRRLGLIVGAVCVPLLVLSPARAGDFGPITSVDLALVVLPSAEVPEADLLTGVFDVGPLVPGVNHAFGLSANDGTQRVSLPIFMEAIADLGVPSRWKSRDDDNPAARFPIDPAHRLDPSVEGALLAIVQEYRDAEQRHWADAAKAYFDLARLIGADPEGSADNPNRERLSVQAREQHRKLTRALRSALPTIERHVARIDDPVQAQAERRRLMGISAELRARMDELERQQPDADPYRARIWAQLSERQRALATDGIVRRYLARRLERDGLSPEAIRHTLFEAAHGAPQRVSHTDMDGGSGVAMTAPVMTGSPTMTGMTGMMSAMSRVDLSAMGVSTEPLTAEDVLSGTVDDSLITPEERVRLEQAHPGALEQRLEQLRRQAVRRVFGGNKANRRSAPTPPLVVEALRGVGWFADFPDTSSPLNTPRTQLGDGD